LCNLRLAAWDAGESIMKIMRAAMLMLTSALAVTAAYAAPPALPPPPPPPAEVVLVNLTGETIEQLYISPCGTRWWGPNQLAGAPLWSSRRFNISNIEPGCYDLMVIIPPWNECIISGAPLRRGMVWKITRSTVVQSVFGDCNITAGVALSGRRPWIWNDR
jgi:hypothetical protein